MQGIARREFARMAGAFAIGSVLASRGIAASPPGVQPDPLALVDPELRAEAAKFVVKEGQFPPPSDKLLPTMREWLQFERPFLPGVPVVQRRIPGPIGAPDVLLYLINAKPDGSRPGILHMHGGGYVAGSAKSGVRDLQELAVALECVIVTVDYRLAPEARYRASLEDNYASLKWTSAHAGELGIDPQRIAVMGESAGGGHAALLAIAARDRGEVPVLFQSLTYPMLDDRTGSSRPAPAHVGQLIWTVEYNRFGWRSFLGQEPGGRRISAAGVPARTENLAGLPPAWIGVGALDLFVDENVQYARRLIDAEIETELLVVPGAYHGFDQISRDATVSRRFTQAKINALKRAFI